MVFGAGANLLHLGTPLPTSCCSCCCWPLVALAHRRRPLLPRRLAELAGPVANVLALHLLQRLRVNTHTSSGAAGQ